MHSHGSCQDQFGTCSIFQQPPLYRDTTQIVVTNSTGPPGAHERPQALWLLSMNPNLLYCHEACRDLLGSVKQEVSQAVITTLGPCQKRLFSVTGTLPACHAVRDAC